ncbi:alpha/beta-hydrolase, partial [Gloeophyllum trabeum ATCC 11539]
MLALLYSLAALSSLLGAFAAPAVHELEDRSVTALSAAQLASFAPYTQLARATYCPGVSNWQCGEACSAVSDFQLTLYGGDGNAVQYYFVGYLPSQQTVVVAHEGTDPTQLLSVLTDGNIILDDLDTSLFPGLTDSTGIQVHSGFAQEHAKTAKPILAEVKRLLAAENVKTVTTVGHSLGGALAELDTLFLYLNLPSDVTVKGITYGKPRVGNPEWAAYFDSKIKNFKHINNEEDIIPIVPGRFLGFQHPAGEIHIVSPGNAVACSGEDDATDSHCTIKTVPNIFSGDILDHLGPYEGISI